MDTKTLQKAVDLGAKLKQVIIATADGNGFPHVATAGKITLTSDFRVKITAWFCPGTVNNVAQNHHISLVVWNTAS